MWETLQTRSWRASNMDNQSLTTSPTALHCTQLSYPQQPPGPPKSPADTASPVLLLEPAFHRSWSPQHTSILHCILILSCCRGGQVGPQGLPDIGETLDDLYRSPRVTVQLGRPPHLTNRAVHLNQGGGSPSCAGRGLPGWRAVLLNSSTSPSLWGGCCWSP